MAIQREEQGRPRPVVERVSDAARRRLWGTRGPLVMLWNPCAVTPLQARVAASSCSHVASLETSAGLPKPKIKCKCKARSR